MRIEVEEEDIENLHAAIDTLAEEIENVNGKVALYAKTLQIAAKYARDAIPGEVPTDMRYFNALVDGKTDPKGVRYLKVWLAEAKKELQELSK